MFLDIFNSNFALKLWISDIIIFYKLCQNNILFSWNIFFCFLTVEPFSIQNCKLETYMTSITIGGLQKYIHKDMHLGQPRKLNQGILSNIKVFHSGSTTDHFVRQCTMIYLSRGGAEEVNN